MRRHDLTRRALLFGGAGYAGHVGLGALTGCGGTTGGKLVELRTFIRGAEADLAGFTNAHGWTVSLFEAKLARGRLEYYTGDASLASRVADALIPSAHAHPGHYQEGEILGEVLGVGVVDIVDGADELPHGRGVSGTLGSARLMFEPNALGGWGIEVVGEAERDGEVRRFIARAATADLLSHHNEPEVWGCPFEGDTELAADGEVTLTVRPSVWFEDVRFELHASASDGSPARFDPLLEPFAAFVAGVRDHRAYVFTYAPS